MKTTTTEQQLSKTAKILVIQQKMIGDVLTSTILLEALRKKYPGAELHYLINSHTAPVVENNPFIDKLVLFTPKMQKNKRMFFSFLKQIRQEKYEVVIDVYGKLSSILMSFFSKAPLRISYHKNYSAFAYTRTVQREKISRHDTSLALENRMKLLEPMGIEYQAFLPKICLSPQETREAKKNLKKSEISPEAPLYMISVLGSSPNKTYPTPYMAKFLDDLIELKPGAQLLFNYIPVQRKAAKSIYDACQPKTQKHIFFDVYAGTLREFMGIVEECDALLGNEGGAINIAKALGKPIFSIFSPWIRKEAWGASQKHSSDVEVHLKDFKPELYENFDQKDFRKNAEKFYQKFVPELLKKKLIPFLENGGKPSDQI